MKPTTKPALWFAACILLASTSARSAEMLAGYDAGFDVEYITPVAEANISTRGCKFTIELSSFLKLLTIDMSAANSTKYEERPDYRVQVVTLDGEDFFISRDGIVRRADSYWLIDTQQLVKIQRPVLTGRCAPRKPPAFITRHGAPSHEEPMEWHLK